MAAPDESGAVITRYQQLIDTAVLSSDSGQHAAIISLQQLYDRLEAAGYLRAGKTGLRSRLGNFFSKQQSQPQGLYLHGGVGRGKTMLMDMFHDSLPEGVCQRFHFHDFMVCAHDLINRARKSGADDPIDIAATQMISAGAIICFDEMEVRDIADAMILKRLFDSLWDRKMVLVATSNRQPDALYLDGLHRDRFLPFIDTLAAGNIVQKIDDGMDWRQRALDSISTWHICGEAGTDSHLDDIFAIVTDHKEQHSEQIIVAGRQLDFDHIAGDVADCQFDQLCARPLAAADYLAVADRVAGLMVRNNPVQNDQQQNDARRFIWLVDALYDRGRFLIASAEAPIDQLYTGQQWAFEFSRTSSRLTEMAQLMQREYQQ